MALQGVLPARCVPDREYPDALWVAVFGDSPAEVTGTEARALALRFMTDHRGGSDGIDAHDGPHVDDGRIQPARADGVASEAGDGMVIGVNEYYRMAAAAAMGASTPGPRRHVCFFRARRTAAIGG